MLEPELEYNEVHNSRGILILQEWTVNGIYHNLNGPAKKVYAPDGTIKKEFYYVNGRLHNDNGPAYITHHRHGHVVQNVYCKNGLIHRENGPAFITYYADGTVEWYFYRIQGLDPEDGTASILDHMECQIYCAERILPEGFKFDDDGEIYRISNRM